MTVASEAPIEPVMRGPKADIERAIAAYLARLPSTSHHQKNGLFDNPFSFGGQAARGARAGNKLTLNLRRFGISTA